MSEVRLIDANALLHSMCCLDGETQCDAEDCIRYKERKYIEAAPTIEAEPVRHGRWIYGRYDEYPTCSCCKQSDTYAGDYCGNCGTKMDLRTPTEVELDIADSVMMGGADNGNG